MRQYLQSTSRVVMLKVFLSSDHVTAATGKTVAITISKAGGAFGNPSAGATNATEVSSGWYKVTLSTTDTATLGDLVVRGTAASCDDSEQIGTVYSPDELLDLAAGVNTGWTLRQALRLMAASMLGKTSGMSGTSATIRNLTDTQDAIVMTVDASGNRSAPTYIKTE